MKTTLTAGEAIRFGWEKMKKHFWFFVGLLILIWLVQVIPTGFANIFKHKLVVLYALFTILAWVLQIIVRMGTIKISLDVIDKGETNFGTLFACAHLFIRFILGTLIYFLIVLAGFVLLIVPGIIWAIKYQFYAYLIVDKNLSPMDAIKKSGEITAGNKGKLFWIGILFGLINIAGAICFLVGLFATIPTTLMAMSYIYRKLMGESGVSEPAELPAQDQAQPAA